MHVFGLPRQPEEPTQAQGEHVNYTQKGLSHNQLARAVNQTSKIIGHKKKMQLHLFNRAIKLLPGD